MSDIPIGSPPVPPGRHAAPGGWYPDPVDHRSERYWDGWQWSRTTRPAEGTSASGVHPYPGPRPAPLPGQPSSDQPYPGQPYGSQPGYPYPAGPPANAPSTQAAVTADGVPLASWGVRLLALLIDSILVWLVTQLFTLPLAAQTASLQLWLDDLTQASRSGGAVDLQRLIDTYPLRDQVVLLTVGLAVAVAYQVVFLRWKSATPGKLVCRLRVVPVGQGHHQSQLDWSTIGIRVAIWVVLGQVVGLFRLIDGLFPLWQRNRQAIHDLAARTQVVVRR